MESSAKKMVTAEEFDAAVKLLTLRTCYLSEAIGFHGNLVSE